MSAERRFLALRDRAYAFLLARDSAPEDAVLAHVYGGAPAPFLRARLAEPLLDDPRVERRSDGSWSVVGKTSTRHAAELPGRAFTALAVAATGPDSRRARIVAIAALHIQDGQSVERFGATVNPGRRVPAYVAERLGLDPAALDSLPSFDHVVEPLTQFLAERPIVAQDVHLAWSFVDAEARRAGRILAPRSLIDASVLANQLVDLKTKPTLALVAAHFGIGTLRVPRPDEEARVLGLVGTRLLVLAAERGIPLTDLTTDASVARVSKLSRAQAAQGLPETPGVYVLRDSQEKPLYVGKARRLRSRLKAYVHRPLGPTRRLEGLVGEVEAVDPTLCATDLEALVLEDRQIRELHPRFNTVRRQRMPRLWIRLPPRPEPGRRKRVPAPRRLELSLGPTDDTGEFVGPFRNETLAEQTRALARAVFDLDALRRSDPWRYEDALGQAWLFLQGQTGQAEAIARQRSRRLLRAVLDFDVGPLLLPADARFARYAVVRLSGVSTQALLLDRGIFVAWAQRDDDDFVALAAALLEVSPPRTTPDDVPVVLRWFGAQRPPARVVLLTDDRDRALDAIVAAASGLRET